jgi:hypothetical protein
MKTKRDLKKQMVKMSKGSFEKEHKHLVKVLKKGSPKEQKKEGEEQEEELKREEKTIKPKKKSSAIEAKKDNYDRKRTTSNGYMVKH